MDGIQDLLVLMRASDGQDAWMRAANIVFFRAQTARNDHAAILVQRLANRLKTFRLGAVEEPACIHNHRFRALVIRRDRIALGAQPRQDPL